MDTSQRNIVVSIRRIAARLRCQLEHGFLPLVFAALTLAGLQSGEAASSVVGPGTVCFGTTNLYSVTTDSPSGVYAWALGTNNTAAAMLIGDTTNATVSILAATNGDFSLECTVDPGGSNEVATLSILVPEPLASSPLTNQIACPGSSVTFVTTITGGPGYDILWRKNGAVIPDLTNPSLTLTNLSPGDAGIYCVEVNGLCDSITNCATLEIISPAVLLGPTNLVLQCLAEVPAPDTNVVSATNALAVFLLGDVAVTNNCEIAITRTYGAVNSCGATSTCAQLILVQDTQAPVFAAPSNRVVEAGSLWDFDEPSVGDNCGDTNIVPVISSTVTNPLCGLTFSATRTWTALDACSNVATCSQTITVLDTTPPVFVGVSNITNEFGSVWDFVVPTASDIADGTNLTITASVVTTNPLCGNTFEAVRIWTAMDSCSNSASFTQTVTVHDTTPPVFTGSSYLTNEFGSVWDFVAPTASDIADGTNLTITSSVVTTNPLCGNTFEAVRTWTATDSCSNSANFTQTVTIHDTTPPVFVGVSNITNEFGSVWDFVAPTASDIADGTNLTITSSVVTTNPLCGNTFEAVRTWTATDSCSNSANFTQTVTVHDTTPPAFTGVTNLVFECGSAWSFQPPTVYDVADGTNLLFVATNSFTNFLCGSTLVATQTWYSIDSCSNAAVFSQFVTVIDTTPPVLSPLTNHTIECGQPLVFDIPTADDVCGGTNVAVAIFNTSTNPLVGETFAATRVWLATDPCGNTNIASQTITIIDTTPPTIFTPSNIVVECVGGAGNIVNYSVSAFDGCDTNVTLTVTPLSGSAFTLGTNTVNCTAVDDSGNTNEATFLVIVVDTTPPNIVCPANMIVSEAPRDSGGATVTFAPPIVLDACDGAPLMTSSPVSGSVFPVGTNTVTWTAVDGSGNSNSCTFTVRVIPYRLFVVSNTDDSGSGSLRQAILDSNDAPDDNLIIFNLTGSGPFNIDLLTPLPPVTSAVTIDGWTQGGSNAAPVVEVRGSSNAFDGLVIQCGRSTVRGLSFHGFATAIRLGGGTNVVQGNFIGVDHTGGFPFGNSADGIFVDSPGNQIGGHTAGTGNLISGNGGNGITLASPEATNNLLQGNLIGAGATITNALPNAGCGIFITNGAAMNLIGGTEINTGNIITFNGAAGVALHGSAGAGNAILGNTISSNTGLAIDLGVTGVDANDNNDPDGGPNGLQNYPLLSDARSAAGVTVIEGGLSSTPNTVFRIEFFLNDVADPTGFGEGLRYLGATQAETKGNGEGAFAFSLPLTAIYTQFVTATATDPEGNTSEFSPAVQVRTPPVIEQQPVSTNSVPGQPVTFCARASGTSPIQYQWRLNGVNIPGATNECYTIPSASLDDGGTYTVIIGNELDAFATAAASLLLGGTNVLNLPVGDNFANAIDLSGYGMSGVIAGDNNFATLEPFEPEHAGKPGGHSVWYRWCTPPGNKGIVTLRTTGSTFDTLLAVYRGNSVTNLYEVESDEDAGRFYSSELRFNAFYNTEINSCYYIAVDGLGGSSGPFVLTWEAEKTSHMLPVILLQPVSQTVLPGATVTFTNFSVPQCSSGHLDCNPLSHWQPNDFKKEKITYQWYFEGQPISGATASSYTITNVQPEHLGNYNVRVFTPWQHLDSRIASLQINDGGESVEAFDKFIDTLLGSVWIVGPSSSSAAPASSGSGPQLAAASVVRGYTGSQIFNTAGSATEPGEVICGVVGGSSEWISLLAEQTGTLFLNTDGSTYDTVMAVFRRNPTNAAALELLNCDNNGGIDGKDSSLIIPVQGGTTNYVLVDGVNGAVGTLYLNYSLVTPTALKVAGLSANRENIIQVTGRPGLNFSIQTSSDLKQWSTLITTTAPDGVYNFTDKTSVGAPIRYYRALIKP